MKTGRIYFHAVDAAAEELHKQLSTGDDLATGLRAWLQKNHGIVVRTLPVHAMPNLRRRYDRHSMRLFLSERLSQPDQLREMAMETCLLALREEIGTELEALGLKGEEARRIARFELARYAAHALMMPYGAFLAAAQRAKYDLDVLRSRFNVSFEQAANRLVSLQRPTTAAIPFFLMEIDNAGNRFRLAGGGFRGRDSAVSVRGSISMPPSRSRGRCWWNRWKCLTVMLSSPFRARWKVRRRVSAKG